MLQQSVLYTAIASRNLLAWGGHVGDTYTAYYPRSAGGKATIRLENIADIPSDRDVTSPDALDANNSTVVPIAEDGSLRFQGTERPGIYQIEVQTQRSMQRDSFAVNVDASESNLTQISLQEAAARVGAQTTVTENSKALTVMNDPYEVRRHGREIWGELLILAVCLMLLESFLSNRESALTTGDRP